ncbi:hypothetical protein PR048_027348 [Dryococelus australis]|uniref:Uncharacterized protein n=1 Tax=Dryococelus australis TaxID=614101 RepID=A0ABQ9GF73_9NEOP|nr:hypothetical protein PR048_027348 [Dryococelus australis]
MYPVNRLPYGMLDVRCLGDRSPDNVYCSELKWARSALDIEAGVVTALAVIPPSEAGVGCPRYRAYCLLVFLRGRAWGRLVARRMQIMGPARQLALASYSMKVDVLCVATSDQT